MQVGIDGERKVSRRKHMNRCSGDEYERFDRRGKQSAESG